MKNSAGNYFQNMPFEEAATQPKRRSYRAMLRPKVNQCPASHVFFLHGVSTLCAHTELILPTEQNLSLSKVPRADSYKPQRCSSGGNTSPAGASLPKKDRAQYFPSAEPDPFRVHTGAALPTSVELLWHKMRMNQACRLSPEL